MGFCTLVTFGFLKFCYTSLIVVVFVVVVSVRANMVTVSYFKFSYFLFSEEIENVAIQGEYGKLRKS